MTTTCEVRRGRRARHAAPIVLVALVVVNAGVGPIVASSPAMAVAVAAAPGPPARIQATPALARVGHDSPSTTATPGYQSATVSWGPPGSDGGAPITGYTSMAADATDPARGGETCIVGTVVGVTGSTPAYTGPDACTVTGLTPGDTYTFTVTATNVAGTGEPSTPSPPIVPSGVPYTPGYWLVGSDGGIFSFGAASFYGSTGSLVLNRPVVGMVPTADRRGYWEVASDGGVFAFGDAGYHGSIPALGIAPAGSPGSGVKLNAPIVAIVPSADGGGYFMVAADGGVFAFGDARFAGSCPGIGVCPGSAVAVMPDASGNGYWLVTSAGDVYAFGDASYLGAPGATSSPITSAVRAPSGAGYWILLADGAVYAYGDAPYLGGAGVTGPSGPATAIFAISDGRGYWIATADGSVSDFGTAPDDGGMSGTHLNGSIIAATGF